MILKKISSNEAGQRFDKYLKKLLKEAPDSFIYKMLRKKNIVLNGKKADGGEKLSIDDEVKFFLADETFERFCGKIENCSFSFNIALYEQAYYKMRDLDIVYEDNHILVVNKPSGILSQKSKSEEISVNEWLIGYLLRKGFVTKESLVTFRPSVCNRLDRNTSGMVVCGKTLAGSQYLSRIIRDKSLEKYYYCLVSGEFSVVKRVTGYLYKDSIQNKVTVYQNKNNVPEAFREEAVFIDTAYHTVRIANNITQLEVQLFTGKPHQIRAQLAAFGYPIIGDCKYGDTKTNQLYAQKGVKSQLLHAHKLIFPVSPCEEFAQVSGSILECPAPKIFNKLMREE